jgi:tRNA-dihydrouridine synthase
MIGEDGLLVGRGAVQQFFLSRDIRQALEKGDTWAMAIWNPEFNGYCIAAMCQS